jgi:hypothetical protein
MGEKHRVRTLQNTALIISGPKNKRNNRRMEKTA